jgi:hypothetical protein
MRLHAAICSVIEAWAEYIKTDTLEREMDHADWAMSQGDADEDF